MWVVDVMAAAIVFAGLVELALAAHTFWVNSGRDFDNAIAQAEYERHDQ